MAEIEFHKGDLFSTRARAIGHGVNVRGVMGAGIAVQFKNRFPDMHRQYRIICQNGDLHPGETFVYEIPNHGGDLYVHNIASQDDPGPHAKLEWLVEGVRASLLHAANKGVYRMAIPRIGSGIGGLDQTEVEEALRALVAQYPVTLEIWTL